MGNHDGVLKRVFAKGRLDVGTVQKAGTSRFPLIDTGTRGLPELPAHVRARQPEDEATEVQRRFEAATQTTKSEIAKLSEKPAPGPRRAKARQANLSDAIRAVFGLDARKGERRPPRTFSESLVEAHVATEILKLEAIQRLLATAPGAVQKLDVGKASPADRQRDLKRERIGAYLDGLQVRRGDE